MLQYGTRSNSRLVLAVASDALSFLTFAFPSLPLISSLIHLWFRVLVDHRVLLLSNLCSLLFTLFHLDTCSQSLLLLLLPPSSMSSTTTTQELRIEDAF